MKEERKIKKTPKDPDKSGPTGQVNPPKFSERKLRWVKCPIFKSKNEEIEKINKAINEAREIKGKAYSAERLIKEADGLLACKLFDEKKPECKICHYIADLRKRTANLILKASPR